MRASDLLPGLAATLLAAAATAPLSARQTPADDPGVSAVLAKLREKHPDVEKAMGEAAGYAVFPTIGKGAIGVGGARGKGVVYAKGRKIGRSTMTQVSIGFQFGGQAYSEIVIFKDEAALASFKGGKLKLDAQASAIALDQRASGDLPYRDGVAIVTMAKGGLMYEASIGGQKFSFTPSGGTAKKPG